MSTDQYFRQKTDWVDKQKKKWSFSIEQIRMIFNLSNTSELSDIADLRC